MDHDLLIIGGGIVGACVARDAAMRGLSALVVEQQDVAFGTSSRSSRLLHGGIRYLAQGRIGLVREASREKTVIGEIAPHLVEPLAFIYPTYRGNPNPHWQLRIGVKIYDWLCRGKNFGPSEAWTAPETLDRVAGLIPAGLTGAVRYYDALTNDARLVIDTLRSAEQQGTRIRTYTRFENAARAGRDWRCTLVDSETGATDTVSVRCVVNAAGPWSDRIPHSRTHLRPTKGAHLVVPRHRLPVPDAVVMTEQRRILFAIPWGERTFIGTTDTDFEGPLETPTCTQEDTAYILGVANAHFPDAMLGPDDVRSTWAGLRPLVANWKGDPSDISRTHEIRMPEPGWIDVTGGKLTTCRLMAEQAVDRVVRFLKHAGPACATAHQPLVDGLPIDGVSGVLPPPVTRDAVAHYCHHEWARHPDDIMIRRSGWQHYVDDPAATAEQVRRWMAELGYPAQPSSAID